MFSLQPETRKHTKKQGSMDCTQERKINRTIFDEGQKLDVQNKVLSQLLLKYVQ